MRNFESSFGKAFTGATKHYDDKIAEVDEYENDLINHLLQLFIIILIESKKLNRNKSGP